MALESDLLILFESQVFRKNSLSVTYLLIARQEDIYQLKSKQTYSYQFVAMQENSAKQTDKDTLVWKDINKHEKTLEAQRFWACYMFLFMMPPKHKDPTWIGISMQTGQFEFTNYQPKCRYDEFVASHSTCCEHNRPQFAFYHRNLMCKFNLALNEADYILRNPSHDDMKKVEKDCEQKGCSEELKQAISYYNDLTEKVRKDNGGKLPWVSLFYWNPMDNLQQVRLPSFFRANSQDAMSLLHNKFKKCKFGQMNYAEQWESEWYKTQERDTLQQDRQQDRGAAINDAILKGFNGFSTVEEMNQLLKLRSDLRVILLNNHLNNADRSKGIGNFCELTDEQLNFLYYGHKFQVYDFQQKKLEISDKVYMEWNLGIASYRYIQGIQMNVTDFFNEINQPHNIMHDSYGFPLKHPFLSIIHPLFMLYHAFIEYLVELSIRRLSPSDHDKLVESLYQTLNKSGNVKQWRTPVNMKTQKKYSADVGPYVEFAFIEEGLDRNIRKSNQLNEFYRSEKQSKSLRLPRQLEDYTFNFTFDILTFSPTQPYEPLYPEFLQRVHEIYLKLDNKSLIKNLLRKTKWGDETATMKKIQQMQRKAGDEKSDDEEIRRRQWKITQNDQSIIKQIARWKVETASGLKPKMTRDLHLLIQKINERKQKLQKLCSLFGRIEYPSTMESSSVKLSIKLRQLQDFEFYNCGSKTVSHLKPRIIGSKGKIVIKVYTVFARGKMATVCPTCRAKKIDSFNLLYDFRGSLLPFLIDLHANARLGILYDSRNPDRSEISFSDLLQTSNDHEDKGFTFNLMKGAKKALFHVQFCRDVQGYDVGDCEKCGKYQYKIVLSAEVYNLTKKTTHMWLQSSQPTVSTNLKFPTIQAKEEEDKVNEGLPENKDELIYLNFVGTLFFKRKAGSLIEPKTFKFELKNYQPEAEYDIRVNSNQEILVRSSQIIQKKTIFQ